jgi:hypothetical protein
MIRIAFLTGFAVLAAPALAQHDQHHPSASQTAPPEAAAPATPPAAAAPETPPASAVPPSEPQAPGQSRQPSSAEVGAMVESEFPRRDGDGNGSLDQSEFSAWLGELVARSPSASSSPGDMDARIQGAFAQTDADGNGSVSAAEMTALLARAR